MTPPRNLLGLKSDISLTELRTALIDKIADLLLSTDILTEPAVGELLLDYFRAYEELLSELKEDDSKESFADYPPYITETVILARAVCQSLENRHGESSETVTSLSNQYSLFKAAIYIRAGKLKAASEELMTSTRINSSDPYLWLWHGELCLRENKSRKAAYMFDTALKLDPYNRELKQKIIKLQNPEAETEPFSKRALHKLKNLFRSE